MTQQVIDIGNVANDGQGDPLRTAFQKTNANFTELYNIGGITGIANGTSNIAIVEDATVSISAANVANVFVVSGTGATNQGLLLSNTISATGNVTVGGFYFGNGSQLTGVISSAPAALITGTTLSSNVTTSTLTSVGVLTNLSVTGNVIGGNLRTAGELSATGNISGQNINTGGAVAATGNITGGNVTTTGQVSAAGNITSGATITASAFIGNGAGLTGFTVSSNAALLTGSLLSANVVNSSLQTVGSLSNLVVSNALGGSGSITANGITLGTTVSATGNITGGNIVTVGSVSATGSGIFGGDITGGNITGNLTDGNIAANNLNATSRVTGAIISASGNVAGGNITTTGQVSAAGNVTGNLLIGTIATASQTNITTVGTLGTLTVTANITGGNINTGGVVSAAGNISGLNIGTTGTVTAATISATGNVNGGNVNATANVVGGNLVTAGLVTVTGNVIGGNLTTGGEIVATGNITGGNTTITGNLISTGTAAFLNATTLAATDPIPSFGRGANNSTLGSATTTDVGAQLYYSDGSEKSAFMGYQLSTGNMVVARQVTISNELITVNTYGNIVVGTVLAQGDVSAVGNVRGGNAIGFANVNATTHTGTTVSVTGNITGGNILGGANVNAVTHTGTTVSVTGNVNGGNVISAAAISGTGLTISGNTATVTSANYQIGYRDLPQITSFSTLVADAGGKHYFGSGTITIPTNASVPLAVGTAILVIASGATTINAASVTLIWAGPGTTGSRTLSTSGQASLVKVGTDTWYISGVGIS
jgi:hypothetical protein